MNTRSSARLSPGALVLALAGLARAQEPAPIDAKFWDQPRGNARGTSVVAVAPVENPPREAWRIDFDELSAEPVVWDGVLFAAGRRGRERVLVAVQTKDGAALATVKLGNGGRLRLAVWSGTVIALDTEGIETYAYRAGAIKLKKRLKGEFTGQPALADGLLFLADGRQLSVYDVDTLKKVAATDAGGGRPSLVPGEKGELLIATYGAGVRTNHEGTYLKFYLASLEGLGTKSLALDAKRLYTGGELNERHARELPGYVALLERSPKSGLTWFVDSHVPFRAEKNEVSYTAITDLEDEETSPIATSAALWDGAAYGFSGEGDLVRFRTSGETQVVVKRGDVPSGGRPGPATGAASVLYLGNWAFDTGSGRVLWCRPELEPTTPLFPLGDRLVVCGDGKGDLVGLVDPGS